MENQESGNIDRNTFEVQIMDTDLKWSLKWWDLQEWIEDEESSRPPLRSWNFTNHLSRKGKSCVHHQEVRKLWRPPYKRKALLTYSKVALGRLAIVGGKASSQAQGKDTKKLSNSLKARPCKDSARHCSRKQMHLPADPGSLKMEQPTRWATCIDSTP